MNAGQAPGSEQQQQQRLSTEEYDRRKRFLDGMKGLTKAEYIEIVRILQKHEVPFSENQNGIFVNIANLAQSVFDDMEKFLNFSSINRKNLSDRDSYISTLATATIVENGDAVSA
jgi:hypothetical protein